MEAAIRSWINDLGLGISPDLNTYFVERIERMYTHQNYVKQRSMLLSAIKFCRKQGILRPIQNMRWDLVKLRRNREIAHSRIDRGY